MPARRSRVNERESYICRLHVQSYTENINCTTRWRSWLRNCATNQRVAGSIPNGVIGIFHWHNPSCRTMTLGLTQPLTEMSTRNIYWGVKAAGAYGWQPYHLHVPIVLKPRSLRLLEPSGPAQEWNGIAFLLYQQVQLWWCMSLELHDVWTFPIVYNQI